MSNKRNVILEDYNVLLGWVIINKANNPFQLTYFIVLVVVQSNLIV